jgi:drug/metabolite transporter (DMT)-like permease
MCPTGGGYGDDMRFFDARPGLSGALGAMSIAFSAIFVKLAAVSPATAAVYRCAYALPALWVLARAERAMFGPRSLQGRRLAWVAGVFLAADLILWHRAIDAVGAGLATVLGNTQVLFVALAAWVLLREKPHAGAFAAIPVVLIGVVLISGIIGERAYGADPMAGVVYGVLTGVAYTGFLLTLRVGNEDVRRPAGPLLDATLSSALASALAGGLLGELELAPSWPAHAWLVALALTSQVLGWLLISVSLPRLPAVMTSLILTLQPVGSVLFGVVLLREDPSRAQLFGVLWILAGLLIARAGRRAEASLEDGAASPARAAGSRAGMSASAASGRPPRGR